ncbi:E3 ubiquitin-protein ligase HUWE1 [Orchesella cincta]|uniref:E3 ubiquitin-protein ligase HUWE1 n=1 Tax=Orchesella cincta TaxID=48709 RepID=A0A1D2NK37_ORCCI|nr:E3 ubiquitin-protein ligase HUWE1 [Orchesella cincta]
MLRPPDCKSLILRIVDCKETQDLTELLKGVQTWTYGKCELYHWIDALDRFDAVLSKATFRADGRWAMACDVNDDSGRELKQCVLQILRFTSLLIEHSFSRTVYNSMDYLTELLYSSDLTLLLENLHLLFMFSKRSNLLTRLPDDKRGLLLEGLYALAESWGGKEAGFGLAACCLKRSLEDYPPTATTVHMEFYRDGTAARNRSESWTVLHIEDVHLMNKSPSRILDECIDIYDVPQDKQLSLLTHLRLAYYFPVWSERVKLVQARLQALSILVYANAIQENIQQLLYSGLMEELVDILELSQDYLTDIKAAALRTLTSIIHLDRAHNFPNIIEATGAGSYHGFLPMMVRNCINSLTSSTPDASQQYPLPLATALFSFLYHLASYELGGEALVNCGMLESLLKVVNWETSDVEYITFVTRAVRVIDLITNMDMQAFQAHNGLTSFINRLEIEVAACRADQPFEIVPEISSASRSQSAAAAEADGSREEGADAQMETDSNTNVMTEQTANTASSKDGAPLVNPGSASSFVHNGTTCLPQRAALLKSMLNFLKKVIQDPAFSDSIRHIMESSLPNSLKHIISNAEYYGASLFLLAIDVVTVYVFQEPSLLHSLQDNGLTDVITEALLMKDVPPTREVISSMPNVFSALCLNSRGLNAFIKCNPFQSLFKVLLSPEYLPAMRRRRTAEPMGDTASNLGNAMDELMRHQPSLKVAATTAIIQLLKHLGCLGGDTTNTCMKSQAKPMVTTLGGNARAGHIEVRSSDEKMTDDEEHQQHLTPNLPQQRQPFLVPVETQLR